MLILGWMLALAVGMGCDKPQKTEVLVGTFTMFDRESTYLIAAPHGEFDEFTGEIVYDFCDEVRWDCLIAEGFRSGQINVNRPTEGVRIKETQFTARASIVYAKYLKRIRRLSPRVGFYVEIHGHDNPSLANSIEISTVGLTDSQAHYIKEQFEEVFREEQLGHLEVRLDKFEEIHYKASHARDFGVLSFISPAIHIEFPRSARTDHREKVVKSLVRVLPTVSAEVFPAGQEKDVAPSSPDQQVDVASRLQLRPLVAVNGEFEDPRINYEVAEKIRLAGGEPIRLPTAGPIDLSPYQALVLVGGRDINPERYGELPDPSLKLLTKERESFDFALVEAALNAKIPILALCLGSEEVWVFLGGSLIQDIPTEIGETVDHRSGYEGHEVTLVKGSRIRKAYRRGSLTVHSNHHQGFDLESLPADLVITATSPDGLPEAFEHTDPERFVLGVLWHPERSENGTILFHALMEAVRK